MHPTSILTLDDSDKMVDQTSYKGMIDSLLYLITSRPNIMFSLYLCACFEADHKKSHLIVVKRIFRYLQGTIALSIVEAKYISVVHCYSHLLWIKHQLVDYNIFKSNIPLLFDNTATINLLKYLILHSRAKNIGIKHHFIREDFRYEIHQHR
ncbi:hypothetical protein CR513_54274, partial [Mucuna pruriens]